jgi:hypothetical protein
MALAWRLAMAFLCLLVRFVQLVAAAVAVLICVAAGVVMAVIALVVLAFVAAEATCGRATRPQACAGSSWGAIAMRGMRR